MHIKFYLFFYKDGFVRFWNAESGRQITSEMIDESVEGSKEDEQKVLNFMKILIRSYMYVLNK